VYFECVWLLYRRFFDCFSVICNKTFYKVYTLFSHTHLTTLSQLLAVGGVTRASVEMSFITHAAAKILKMQHILDFHRGGATAPSLTFLESCRLYS